MLTAERVVDWFNALDQNDWMLFITVWMTVLTAAICVLTVAVVIYAKRTLGAAEKSLNVSSASLDYFLKPDVLLEGPSEVTTAWHLAETLATRATVQTRWNAHIEGLCVVNNSPQHIRIDDEESFTVSLEPTHGLHAHATRGPGQTDPNLRQKSPPWLVPNEFIFDLRLWDTIANQDTPAPTLTLTLVVTLRYTYRGREYRVSRRWPLSISPPLR